MTQKYKTSEEINYSRGSSSKVIVIPKGSAVFPADTVPKGFGFWLKDLPEAYWEDFTAIDWHMNHGILLNKVEVELA
jgi:hypothetical protein